MKIIVKVRKLSYKELEQSYKNALNTIERLNNKIKEQNLLLIEFQDMEQKVNIYKSRCEKANDFIDNYDVFKEFSFPLMKRDIENQIKSSIDYEFNSTFRKKLKNILNGSDENEYRC